MLTDFLDRFAVGGLSISNNRCRLGSIPNRSLGTNDMRNRVRGEE